MASALELARLAPAHGDVPVGAVVLAADGAVVGSGHNDREGAGDPTAHAEVLALCAEEGLLPADVLTTLCERAGCDDVLESLREG